MRDYIARNIEQYLNKMGIASANLDSAYSTFFDSIMDGNMFSSPSSPFESIPSLKDGEIPSDPNERLPSPRTIPPPAPADVEEEIGQNWLATTKKTRTLQDRLMLEKAKLKVAVQKFRAEQCSDKAVQIRLETHEKWLQSMLKNLKSAVQDHKLAQGHQDMYILKNIVRRIERRQKAVEVALQQGPSQHIDNDGQDATVEDKEGRKEKDKEKKTRNQK